MLPPQRKNRSIGDASQIFQKRFVGFRSANYPSYVTFEHTCADLHVLAGDQRGRETIATRIINLAGNGGIDATALHKRVVTEAHFRT